MSEETDSKEVKEEKVVTIMATPPPPLAPANFRLDINASNMALEWSNFETSLTIYLVANNLHKENNERKVAILQNILGQDALPILKSFNVALSTVKYEDLMKQYRDYFTPQVNITTERHKLFNHKQGPDEEIESYATGLQNICQQCDMGNKSDDILKDIFSWNLNDSNAYIKERILIEKPKSFKEAVSLAQAVRNTKLAKSVLMDYNNSQVTQVKSQQLQPRQRQQSYSQP